MLELLLGEQQLGAVTSLIMHVKTKTKALQPHSVSGNWLYSRRCCTDMFTAVTNSYFLHLKSKQTRYIKRSIERTVFFPTSDGAMQASCLLNSKPHAELSFLRFDCSSVLNVLI